MYIHIFFRAERCWSGKRIKKKIGALENAACQGNLSACHRFVSPGLRAALRGKQSLPFTGWRNIREKEKRKIEIKGKEKVKRGKMI